MSALTQFRRLTGDDTADDRAEAINGLRHAASLSMTKVADGLIDPKLVLAWLLSSLGTPALLIGLLVPIREAGSLLPQIVLALGVQKMKRRKWAWVAGAAGQAAAVAAMVLAGLALEGIAAGVAICGALAVFAVFRAAASVSYREILGKTIARRRRGAITGAAGSLSAVGVVIFALLLMSGLFESRGIILSAMVLAAMLFAGAALVFATMQERPSEVAGQRNGLDFSVLKGNAQLWRFIVVRGLLVSTALAPPYLVLLAEGSGLERLGALVLASALASLLSSYVWGRLADRSSRQVLIRAGLLGALAIGAAVVLDLTGLSGVFGVLSGVIFVLMIAYHGVRQGRSTYLVDMAPEDRRAAYTAVSNTVIGALLLAAGAFGGLASVLGPLWTLAGFALMAVAAAVVALGLDEVQHPPDRD